MNLAADVLGAAANPKAGHRVGRAGGQGECPTRKDFLFPAAFSTRPAQSARRRAGASGVGNAQEQSPRGLHLRRRAHQARPVGRAPLGGGYPHPHHARHHAQYPDRRLGHGYRDRGAASPSPWRRPAASASFTAISNRRTGRAGPPREEIRKRHGGQSGDHRAGCDACRRAGADGAASHLRHPGGRRAPARARASWSASSPTATCASPPTRASRCPS